MSMLSPTEILSSLETARGDGRPIALVSLIEVAGKVVDPIPRILVSENGASVAGSLGSESLDENARRAVQDLIQDDQIEIVTRSIGDERILIEVSRPPLALVVCGGGHVGRAVAAAGRLLDLQVTVIDDREDFASRGRFPDASINVIATDFTTALRELKITPATHIVIVTRGHKHDELCLREVIEQPARYIGMIGSRRRTTTIREHLRREGVRPELLRRVHAPIGLDIGARTPEEIALAVLAEIVMVRRGGTGKKKSEGGPMAKTKEVPSA